MLDAFLIRTSAVFVAIPLKHNIYDENSDDTMHRDYWRIFALFLEWRSGGKNSRQFNFLVLKAHMRYIY